MMRRIKHFYPKGEERATSTSSLRITNINRSVLLKRQYGQGMEESRWCDRVFRTVSSCSTVALQHACGLMWQGPLNREPERLKPCAPNAARWKGRREYVITGVDPIRSALSLSASEARSGKDDE